MKLMKRKTTGLLLVAAVVFMVVLSSIPSLSTVVTVEEYWLVDKTVRPESEGMPYPSMIMTLCTPEWNPEGYGLPISVSQGTDWIGVKYGIEARLGAGVLSVELMDEDSQYYYVKVTRLRLVPEPIPPEPEPEPEPVPPSPWSWEWWMSGQWIADFINWIRTLLGI